MDNARRARGNVDREACPENTGLVSLPEPSSAKCQLEYFLRVSVRPLSWSLYGIHLFIGEFGGNLDCAPRMLARARYRQINDLGLNSSFSALSVIDGIFTLLAPHLRARKLWVTVPGVMILNEGFIQDFVSLIEAKKLVKDSLGVVLPRTSSDTNGQVTVASLQRLRAVGVGVALPASSMSDLDLIPDRLGAADVLIADDSLVGRGFGLREGFERKPWWIDRAQRSGLDVVISGVNSTDRLRVYSDFGIAGIFGDSTSRCMTGENIIDFLGANDSRYSGICADSL